MTTEVDGVHDRPLFRTDGFEMIDETWTHGAFIGGLAGADGDDGLADNYLMTADLMVERALRDDLVHVVVLPALFLYRHALELRLKAAVRPERPDHDLDGLVQRLNAMLRDNGTDVLQEQVVERISEIARFDPRADAFRFHASRPRRASPGLPHFPEEVWVDVRNLPSTVRWIDRELRAATARLGGGLEAS